MASQGHARGNAVPTLVYRAEAYDDQDRYREKKWGCSHNHDSVEQAFHCGMAWLNDRLDESAAETA